MRKEDAPLVLFFRQFTALIFAILVVEGAQSISGRVMMADMRER
jgi:hypothetical protein